MPNKGGLTDRDNPLPNAVLTAWCEQATGDISVRALAVSAAISPSAIYYHYDDLEHLYEAAQRVALGGAQAWCTAQSATLDRLGERLPLAPEALAPLLAALIDAWCEEQRRLAFAWREGQVLAARGARFRPSAEAWTALWRDFWADVAGRFGLSDAAELLLFFFEGESILHLMRWNRAADRASLDETARAFVAWMTGRSVGGAPWRHALKGAAQGMALLMDAPGATAQEIAKAAATLLIEGGVSAVTHRAVAASAGLTLGVVSHNCKRADDLLRLAYGEIYRSLSSGAGSRPPAATPSQVPPLETLPARAQMLAVDELLLAVARGRADPELAQSLRYLRGTTSRQELSFPAGAAGELLAAVFSSVMMGALRTLSREPEETALPRIDALRARLAGLVAALA
jgi:AcrR family transcriptional regulator